MCPMTWLAFCFLFRVFLSQWLVVSILYWSVLRTVLPYGVCLASVNSHWFPKYFTLIWSRGKCRSFLETLLTLSFRFRTFDSESVYSLFHFFGLVEVGFADTLDRNFLFLAFALVLRHFWQYRSWSRTFDSVTVYSLLQFLWACWSIGWIGFADTLDRDSPFLAFDLVLRHFWHYRSGLRTIFLASHRSWNDYSLLRFPWACTTSLCLFFCSRLCWLPLLNQLVLHDVVVMTLVSFSNQKWSPATDRLNPFRAFSFCFSNFFLAFFGLSLSDLLDLCLLLIFLRAFFRCCTGSRRI